MNLVEELYIFIKENINYFEIKIDYKKRCTIVSFIDRDTEIKFVRSSRVNDKDYVQIGEYVYYIDSSKVITDLQKLAYEKSNEDNEIRIRPIIDEIQEQINYNKGCESLYEDSE